MLPKGAHYLRPVRPSVVVHQRRSNWMDFNEIGIGDFIKKKLSRKSKLGSNWAKVSGTLHEDR
jgi:hypothetical protein